MNSINVQPGGVNWVYSRYIFSLKRIIFMFNIYHNLYWYKIYDVEDVWGRREGMANRVYNIFSKVKAKMAQYCFLTAAGRIQKVEA